MKKVAVITGASRGIGLSVAKYLASKNYNLALIATNQELLKRVKGLLLAQNKEGIDITTHSQDVSKVNNTKELIHKIAKDMGRLDVLFHSAGIADAGTSDLETDKFSRMQAINVHGTFSTNTAVAEIMKKQGHGYIINVSSMSGIRGLARNGGYAMSKFAVTGWSEALMKELVGCNVKVTAICPSVIDTDLTKNFDLSNDNKIQCSDVVKTVEYLLSLSPQVSIDKVAIQCSALI